MSLQELRTALHSLSKSVSNFHVGAISTDDFKPLQERIRDMRHVLKLQKAHWLLVKAKHEAGKITEKSHEDVHTTVSILHEEVAYQQILNTAVNLCIQSCSIDDIMNQDESPIDLKNRIKGYLKKLFVLNDALISTQNSMKEALISELNLKIECQKALFEYRRFLKEQEELRDKKLEETRPEILRNKKKVETKLGKINLMKRLMTNMIAAAGNILIEKPFLVEMMKKHRELINIEKIIEMARETDSPDTS